MKGGGAIADTIPRPEEIVWTCQRAPLPPQLAGRVPDAVWAATFDAVAQRVAEDAALDVCHRQLATSQKVSTLFEQEGAARRRGSEFKGSGIGTKRQEALTLSYLKEGW